PVKAIWGSSREVQGRLHTNAAEILHAILYIRIIWRLNHLIKGIQSARKPAARATGKIAKVAYNSSCRSKKKQVPFRCTGLNLLNLFCSLRCRKIKCGRKQLKL